MCNTVDYTTNTIVGIFYYFDLTLQIYIFMYTICLIYKWEKNVIGFNFTINYSILFNIPTWVYQWKDQIWYFEEI